jgi:peptidyl-tRNA hydrolase ICT1
MSTSNKNMALHITASEDLQTNIYAQNRVSSKATLRLPTSSILPLLPPILRQPLLSSRYYAPKSEALIVQADDSRKQADNANACFRRLHSLILEIGRESVPNETGAGQAERVAKLQKAEAAGRRKMKERLSGKKAARRGGGRGED